MRKKSESVFEKLSPFDNEKGELNVIIDTPKGSRNKYKYDEDLGLFKLGGVLAVGHFFPFDFGYIPQTLGGDGDPLDVLVLMDEPAFVGCLIRARLIGVIEAEQTEDGKTENNDRLIALASDSRVHKDITSINDLNPKLIDEIEHFFVSYNEAKGKTFNPLARFGARKAKSIVEEGIKLYKKPQKSKSKTQNKKK
ncbi:MAG: inorganic diphosphatase [Acidobacteriota bacterium]|nr:inorganic diphosphatase [Acidobacteriota bacterium]